MMDNARFEALSERRQQAHAVKLTAHLFGRATAQRLKKQVSSVARDNLGHGLASEVSDSEHPHDPKDNFWQGHWQVYDTF